MSELSNNIFIITNQSGVGRRLISKEQVKSINAEIEKKIRENGGHIAKTYFDASTPELPSRKRKPQIGMVLYAISEFNISLAKSWVIGDKDSDIELGKFTNMKTILIKNSKYKYKSILKPDFEARNLSEAFNTIKKFNPKKT